MKRKRTTWTINRVSRDLDLVEFKFFSREDAIGAFAAIFPSSTWILDFDRKMVIAQLPGDEENPNGIAYCVCPAKEN